MIGRFLSNVSMEKNNVRLNVNCFMMSYYYLKCLESVYSIKSKNCYVY